MLVQPATHTCCPVCPVIMSSHMHEICCTKQKQVQSLYVQSSHTKGCAQAYAGTKAQLIMLLKHAHLNVCANLANHIWITKAVQVVILYLQKQQQHTLHPFLSRASMVVTEMPPGGPQHCEHTPMHRSTVNTISRKPGESAVLTDGTTSTAALLTCKCTLQCTHPQAPRLDPAPRQSKSACWICAVTHPFHPVHALYTSLQHGEACLKVLPHDQQDLLGSLEGSRLVDASHEHATGHRQIEGVVRRLEGHNTHVVVDCELGQVCCARRGCGQVQQLPMCCLVCRLQDGHRLRLCASAHYQASMPCAL